MDAQDKKQLEAVIDANREVYLIAKELIKACKRHGLALTGFIYNLHKEPPVFMHIGDVNEGGPDLTALHLKLCDALDSGNVRLLRENVQP